MIRHPKVFFYAALAVASALMVPATAQTQTEAKPKGGQVACAEFLAMEDGAKNTVAAVVEQDLKAQMPQPTQEDLAMLTAAGIDPAAAVAPAPPLPGETMRVMREACEANAGATVMDALTMPPQDTAASN